MSRSQRPKDPYWSLWGKIKARERRNAAEIDEDWHWHDEILDDQDADLPPLRLPQRGTEVGGGKDCITVCGVTKPVNSDFHAVNTLRKLDRDDVYFDESTKEQEMMHEPTFEELDLGGDDDRLLIPPEMAVMRPQEPLQELELTAMVSRPRRKCGSCSKRRRLNGDRLCAECLQAVRMLAAECRAVLSPKQIEALTQDL